MESPPPQESCRQLGEYKREPKFLIDQVSEPEMEAEFLVNKMTVRCRANKREVNLPWETDSDEEGRVGACKPDNAAEKTGTRHTHHTGK